MTCPAGRMPVELERPGTFHDHPAADVNAAHVDEDVPLAATLVVGVELLEPTQPADDRQDDAGVCGDGGDLVDGTAHGDRAPDGRAHQPSTGMVCFAANFDSATCMTLVT